MPFIMRLRKQRPKVITTTNKNLPYKYLFTQLCVLYSHHHCCSWICYLLMLYELKSFVTILKQKLSPITAKASSLLWLDPDDVYSHLGY